MRKLTIGAAAALAVFGAGSASAATQFDFTTKTVVLSKGGLTLTYEGWGTKTASASSLPIKGTATAYQDYGIGVRGVSSNGSSDAEHPIDNIGGYDFVRLVFNKPVSLDQISLGAWGDTDAWISYGDSATSMTSVQGWKGFLDRGKDFLGNSANRTFDPAIKATGTVWLIGAARGTAYAGNDSFKITALSVTAVPELGTWAMMILGVGAVGVAMRRRPKVRTSVTYA